MNRRETVTPRLVLFSPPVDPARATVLIADACRAADVASIVLRTAGLTEERILAYAKAILPVAIEEGAALLLEDRADLVEETKADGAHFTNFMAQAPRQKPRFIAGAAGLVSRHDAMTAGEAGADYVMFGEPIGGKRPALDAIVERVAWWAEIFQIPCVAYAASLGEAPALVRAGADFIALDDAIWGVEAHIDALGAAMAHLQTGHAE